MHKYLLTALTAICFCGALKAQQFLPEKNSVKVSIDAAEIHQTIDNFGASDAWSVQFVGSWPDAKRNALADLLFSTENDAQGKPKGIGLSLWRFNLGAGSTRQGKDSKIRDEWRRNPSFLDSSGNYSWDQQAAQLWFLRAAKQRGVKEFVAFVNSPPVEFTKNHLAFSSDGKSNIHKDQYPAFADYLSKSMIGIKKTTGIEFNYLSPVNEPQWEWKDGSQEGSPYTNEEIAALSKVLDESLTKYKLSSKITLPEAGQLDYLLREGDKKTRGDQLRYFFGDESTRLDHLPHIAPILAGHSYFTTSPLNASTQLRQELKARVQKVKGLKYWMTEYSILGDNAGEIKGGKRDLGMDAALYIAKAVHQDLVQASAAAWQWWLAISPYNYKDGLIYVDKEKNDGQFYPSKMLWVMGNYSRFIRPGAKRVGLAADSSLNQETAFFSAYRNVSGKNQIVVVLVNLGNDPIPLKIALKGVSASYWKPYVTSETQDLQPLSAVAAEGKIVLPPRSVMTLLSSK